MLSLNINEGQFSDFLNLYHKVFFPLKTFVNEKNFKSILDKKRIGKKFFPIPISFGITRTVFKKIKNKSIIKINYRKKKLAIIQIKSIFKIDHKTYGRKIFGKKFRYHSYFLKFKKENYAFLDFKYLQVNKKNFFHKNFISPKQFKEKFKAKLKKNSNLAGFHTRNVPHAAHQWIHKFLIRKYSKILIQPLIGQYKNEYLDKIIKNKSYCSKNV